MVQTKKSARFLLIVASGEDTCGKIYWIHKPVEASIPLNYKQINLKSKFKKKKKVTIVHYPKLLRNSNKDRMLKDNVGDTSQTI